MYQHESTDYSDPRSLLEEGERQEQLRQPVLTKENVATFHGRVQTWYMEGRTLQNIGLRVLVATKKLRPELVQGVSFEKMAKRLGYGRSAAHKLSREFTDIFGIFGQHDKSVDARQKYRKAWIRTNTIPCPTKQSPRPAAIRPPTRSAPVRS